MSSLPISTTTAHQPKPRTNFTIDFLLGNERSPRDVEDSPATLTSLPAASFTSTTTIRPFVLSEPLLMVRFADDLRKTAINRSDSTNGMGLQRAIDESSCWYRSPVDRPNAEFIPTLRSFNALRAAAAQRSPCSPLSQQRLAPLADLNKFDSLMQRNIKPRWLPSDKDSSFTSPDRASLEVIRNPYGENSNISDVKAGESKWCCQPVCRYGYGSSFHYKRKRFRTAFTASQMARLESSFRHSRYAIGSERRTLSRDLGLTETQVKVWFQNRRTKYRKIRELCTGERGQLMPSLYSNKPESPSSTSTTSPLSFPRSTCCDVSVARQRTPAYNVTGCWSPPTVESSTLDDFS